MSIGDIFYIFAFILFAFMTFVIIRNYFRNKFDDEGKRIDMQEKSEEDSQ
jgi:hypothetical protein